MRKWMAVLLMLCMLLSTLQNPVYGAEMLENAVEESVIETVEEAESAEEESDAKENAEEKTESEAEDEPETEDESETETEPETEIESETETEPETEIESETETEPETEIESETEKEKEKETEPEIETIVEEEKEQTHSEEGEEEIVVYGPDERTEELLEIQYELVKEMDTLNGVSGLEYAEQLALFPESYKPYLEALHELYPNWIFKAVETGLDWKDAVAAESSDNRSLISSSSYHLLRSNAEGDYDPETGKYIAKDGSSWYTASRSAVAYFMDPRNFLNEQYIMMFEANTYDKAYHKLSGVEAILNGTFMSKVAIDYLDKKGNTIQLEETYGETIWGAGVESGVSPLYLAAKIRQEIGSQKSGSVTGNYGKYPGIYNFYNIGATSGSDPISNGLKWASSGDTYLRPWTTPVLSIYGGAQYIGEQYILKGQNTGYYMRFNVSPDRYYATYNHQYMTNVYGAANEAYSAYKSYNEIGVLADPKVFYIPVYKNMPNKNTAVVIDGNVRTGFINTSGNVNVRSVPSTNGSKTGTIESGTPVKIVSGDIWSTYYTSSMLVYPYWYKVEYEADGSRQTGYVCAEYVTLDSSMTIPNGGSQKLTLKKGSKETIYYETSNPAIAVVSADGTIEAVGEGYVEIYAISGSGKMDAIGITVGEGVTYTVTLDPNGGEGENRILSYNSGRALGDLPVPDRNDYVFQGWYTKKSGGEPVTSATKVTQDLTLYAQWKKSIEASTITVSKVNSKMYKAAAWKPAPTVKDDGVKLIKGTDYTLSYNKNKNPGTATITITGTGQYAGSRTLTFKIVPVTNRHITTENLNYRTGAGTSYKKVGTLNKGTYVQVVYKSETEAGGYTWYMIKVDGKYYWAVGEYLKLSQTTTTYTTTGRLNYRNGPGSWYALAGTFAKGKNVTVINGYSSKASGYVWYKIKVDGKYYFAASEYLKKEVLVSYKTTAALNYRKGPGLSYEKAGSIANGQTVKVVSGYSKKADGYTWYKIKLNSKYYYVVSSYLKK